MLNCVLVVQSIMVTFYFRTSCSKRRPKIADFERQYRHVCVDEADLNEAQYRLLCSLCGKAYYNIMMVGDPKQAIYVFNGADPKYMEFFQRDFSAKRITLWLPFAPKQSLPQLKR